MKIAITGDTAGIGLALSEELSYRGHDIVGLSKRNGYNIRITPKIVDLIKQCDMFVNNAQVDFAQTQLLYGVWKCWQECPGNIIWNISTMLTQCPSTTDITDLDPVDMNMYRNQKLALEDAHNQLKFFGHGPKMCLIKPGNIQTHSGKTNACNTTVWAKTVVDTYVTAHAQGMHLEEISIGWLSNKDNQI
jgi:hypothetical protein